MVEEKEIQQILKVLKEKKSKIDEAITTIINENEKFFVETMSKDCIESAKANIHLNKRYTIDFCTPNVFHQYKRDNQSGLNAFFLTIEPEIINALKNNDYILDYGYCIRSSHLTKKESLEILQKRLDCKIEDFRLIIQLTDVTKRLLEQIRQKCLEMAVKPTLIIQIDEKYYDEQGELALENSLKVKDANDKIEYPCLVIENQELIDCRSEIIIYAYIEPEVLN